MPNERSGEGIVNRLAGAWRLLLGTAAALVVLLLAGSLSLAGALVAFAVVSGLVALLPGRDEASPRRASETAVSAASDPAMLDFVEALPDPCYLLDRRGSVLYANERARQTFPIKTGELLTFRLRAPDFLAAFDRVAKGGGAERVEFSERVPTERWFAGSFSALPATPGRPGQDLIVLILDDLTERRHAERIRADFVANASHELRTPLASLSGFIETLQGPARDDAATRERFLAIMREQATRMSRLIDDLLSLSRIEMSAHMRPSGTVDLVSVLRHVVDALEPLARELGVTIETDIPDGTLDVTGDRDELVQVFENLVENACKYGQSGGRVVVALAGGGKGAGPVASVRDFGPGIPSEHVPRLTERFYRIDADASRAHRGTGLGLAIVKHIVNRHRARLVIESESGSGSTFSVHFQPASGPESAPVHRSQGK